MNDEWNNRASAESWVMSYYPTTKIEFIVHTSTEKLNKLNKEWEACKYGVG